MNPLRNRYNPEFVTNIIIAIIHQNRNALRCASYWGMEYIIPGGREGVVDHDVGCSTSPVAVADCVVEGVVAIVGTPRYIGDYLPVCCDCSIEAICDRHNGEYV